MRLFRSPRLAWPIGVAWGSRTLNSFGLVERANHLGSVGPTGYYSDFQLSPDEKQVVVRSIDPEAQKGDLWLLQMLPGIPLRLTFHPEDDRFPIWSPDGSRIVFHLAPHRLL